MKVTVLSGGVGGARFVLGLRAAVARRWPDGAGGTTAQVTVIANTGDDVWISGVRLQPDVDSLVYALAGVNDADRGWGRAGETERVADELHAWGAGWPWFTLGDLDLGTHVARTGWLRDGETVSQIVGRLSGRWPLGVRLLPMTDAEVDTHVLVDGGAMHFQEWWVRHRAQLPAQGFSSPGIEDARPAPGVVEALLDADVVLLAPSNPVVSLGPILAVPGIADAVRATRASVVGVSPIIAGAAVRGMADACLRAVGIATTADAVGRHYGGRRSTAAGGGGRSRVEPGTASGLLDVWLVAEEDAGLVDGLAAAGVRAIARPLWMRDAASAERLAADALDAAFG